MPLFKKFLAIFLSVCLVPWQQPAALLAEEGEKTAAPAAGSAEAKKADLEKKIKALAVRLDALQKSLGTPLTDAKAAKPLLDELGRIGKEIAELKKLQKPASAALIAVSSKTAVLQPFVEAKSGFADVGVRSLELKFRLDAAPASVKWADEEKEWKAVQDKHKKLAGALQKAVAEIDKLPHVDLPESKRYMLKLRFDVLQVLEEEREACKAEWPKIEELFGNKPPVESGKVAADVLADVRKEIDGSELPEEKKTRLLRNLVDVQKRLSSAIETSDGDKKDFHSALGELGRVFEEAGIRGQLAADAYSKIHKAAERERQRIEVAGHMRSEEFKGYTPDHLVPKKVGEGPVAGDVPSPGVSGGTAPTVSGTAEERTEELPGWLDGAKEKLAQAGANAWNVFASMAPEGTDAKELALRWAQLGFEPPILPGANTETLLKNLTAFGETSRRHTRYRRDLVRWARQAMERDLPALRAFMENDLGNASNRSRRPVLPSEADLADYAKRIEALSKQAEQLGPAEQEKVRALGALLERLKEAVAARKAESRRVKDSLVRSYEDLLDEIETTDEPSAADLRRLYEKRKALEEDYRGSLSLMLADDARGAERSRAPVEESFVEIERKAFKTEFDTLSVAILSLIQDSPYKGELRDGADNEALRKRIEDANTKMADLLERLFQGDKPYWYDLVGRPGENPPTGRWNLASETVRTGEAAAAYAKAVQLVALLRAMQEMGVAPTMLTREYRAHLINEKGEVLKLGDFVIKQLSDRQEGMRVMGELVTELSDLFKGEKKSPAEMKAALDAIFTNSKYSGVLQDTNLQQIYGEYSKARDVELTGGQSAPEDASRAYLDTLSRAVDFIRDPGDKTHKAIDRRLRMRFEDYNALVYAYLKGKIDEDSRAFEADGLRGEVEAFLKAYEESVEGFRDKKDPAGVNHRRGQVGLAFQARALSEKLPVLKARIRASESTTGLLTTLEEYRPEAERELAHRIETYRSQLGSVETLKADQKRVRELSAAYKLAQIKGEDTSTIERDLEAAKKSLTKTLTDLATAGSPEIDWSGSADEIRDQLWAKRMEAQKKLDETREVRRILNEDVARDLRGMGLLNDGESFSMDEIRKRAEHQIAVEWARGAFEFYDAAQEYQEPKKREELTEWWTGLRDQVLKDMYHGTLYTPPDSEKMLELGRRGGPDAMLQMLDIAGERIIDPRYINPAYLRKVKALQEREDARAKALKVADPAADGYDPLKDKLSPWEARLLGSWKQHQRTLSVLADSIDPDKRDSNTLRRYAAFLEDLDPAHWEPAYMSPPRREFLESFLQTKPEDWRKQLIVMQRQPDHEQVVSAKAQLADAAEKMRLAAWIREGIPVDNVDKTMAMFRRANALFASEAGDVFQVIDRQWLRDSFREPSRFEKLAKDYTQSQRDHLIYTTLEQDRDFLHRQLGIRLGAYLKSRGLKLDDLAANAEGLRKRAKTSPMDGQAPLRALAQLAEMHIKYRGKAEADFAWDKVTADDPRGAAAATLMFGARTALGEELWKAGQSHHLPVMSVYDQGFSAETVNPNVAPLLNRDDIATFRRKTETPEGYDAGTGHAAARGPPLTGVLVVTKGDDPTLQFTAMHEGKLHQIQKAASSESGHEVFIVAEGGTKLPKDKTKHPAHVVAPQELIYVDSKGRIFRRNEKNELEGLSRVAVDNDHVKLRRVYQTAYSITDDPSDPKARPRTVMSGSYYADHDRNGLSMATSHHTQLDRNDMSTYVKDGETLTRTVSTDFLGHSQFINHGDGTADSYNLNDENTGRSEDQYHTVLKKNEVTGQFEATDRYYTQEHTEDGKKVAGKREGIHEVNEGHGVVWSVWSQGVKTDEEWKSSGGPGEHLANIGKTPEKGFWDIAWEAMKFSASMKTHGLYKYRPGAQPQLPVALTVSVPPPDGDNEEIRHAMIAYAAKRTNQLIPQGEDYEDITELTHAFFKDVFAEQHNGKRVAVSVYSDRGISASIGDLHRFAKHSEIDGADLAGLQVFDGKTSKFLGAYIQAEGGEIDWWEHKVSKTHKRTDTWYGAAWSVVAGQKMWKERELIGPGGKSIELPEMDVTPPPMEAGGPLEALHGYGLWGIITGAPIADAAAILTEEGLVALGVDRKKAKIAGAVVGGITDIAIGCLVMGNGIAKVFDVLSKIKKIKNYIGIIKLGVDAYFAFQVAKGTYESANAFYDAVQSGDEDAIAGSLRGLISSAGGLVIMGYAHTKTMKNLRANAGKSGTPGQQAPPKGVKGKIQALNNALLKMYGMDKPAKGPKDVGGDKKPNTRKPKTRKPKSKKPKSRKPNTRKPKSRKPNTRKPPRGPQKLPTRQPLNPRAPRPGKIGKGSTLDAPSAGNMPTGTGAGGGGGGGGGIGPRGSSFFGRGGGKPSRPGARPGGNTGRGTTARGGGNQGRGKTARGGTHKPGQGGGSKPGKTARKPRSNNPRGNQKPTAKPKPKPKSKKPSTRRPPQKGPQGRQGPPDVGAAARSGQGSVSGQGRGTGGRKLARKPTASKPKSKKPRAKKPASKKPKGKKPQARKPKGKKPQAKKPKGKKPQAKKPKGKKPQAKKKPKGKKPQAKKKPKGKKPQAKKKPKGKKPQAKKKQTKKPQQPKKKQTKKPEEPKKKQTKKPDQPKKKQTRKPDQPKKRQPKKQDQPRQEQKPSEKPASERASETPSETAQADAPARQPGRVRKAARATKKFLGDQWNRSLVGRTVNKVGRGVKKVRGAIRSGGEKFENWFVEGANRTLDRVFTPKTAKGQVKANKANLRIFNAAEGVGKVLSGLANLTEGKRFGTPRPPNTAPKHILSSYLQANASLLARPASVPATMGEALNPRLATRPEVLKAVARGRTRGKVKPGQEFDIHLKINPETGVMEGARLSRYSGKEAPGRATARARMNADGSVEILNVGQLRAGRGVKLSNFAQAHHNHNANLALNIPQYLPNLHYGIERVLKDKAIRERALSERVIEADVFVDRATGKVSLKPGQGRVKIQLGLEWNPMFDAMHVRTHAGTSKLPGISHSLNILVESGAGMRAGLARGRTTTSLRKLFKDKNFRKQVNMRADVDGMTAWAEVTVHVDGKGRFRMKPGRGTQPVTLLLEAPPGSKSFHLVDYQASGALSRGAVRSIEHFAWNHKGLKLAPEPATAKRGITTRLRDAYRRIRGTAEFDPTKATRQDVVKARQKAQDSWAKESLKVNQDLARLSEAVRKAPEGSRARRRAQRAYDARLAKAQQKLGRLGDQLNRFGIVPEFEPVTRSLRQMRRNPKDTQAKRAYEVAKRQAAELGLGEGVRQLRFESHRANDKAARGRGVRVGTERMRVKVQDLLGRMSRAEAQAKAYEAKARRIKDADAAKVYRDQAVRARAEVEVHRKGLARAQAEIKSKGMKIDVAAEKAHARVRRARQTLADAEAAGSGVKTARTELDRAIRARERLPKNSRMEALRIEAVEGFETASRIKFQRRSAQAEYNDALRVRRDARARLGKMGVKNPTELARQMRGLEEAGLKVERAQRAVAEAEGLLAEAKAGGTSVKAAQNTLQRAQAGYEASIQQMAAQQTRVKSMMKGGTPESVLQQLSLWESAGDAMKVLQPQKNAARLAERRALSRAKAAETAYKKAGGKTLNRGTIDAQARWRLGNEAVEAGWAGDVKTARYSRRNLLEGLGHGEASRAARFGMRDASARTTGEAVAFQGSSMDCSLHSIANNLAANGVTGKGGKPLDIASVRQAILDTFPNQAGRNFLRRLDAQGVPASEIGDLTRLVALRYKANVTSLTVPKGPLSKALKSARRSIKRGGPYDNIYAALMDGNAVGVVLNLGRGPNGAAGGPHAVNVLRIFEGRVKGKKTMMVEYQDSRVLGTQRPVQITLENFHQLLAGTRGHMMTGGATRAQLARMEVRADSYVRGRTGGLKGVRTPRAGQPDVGGRGKKLRRGRLYDEMSQYDGYHTPQNNQVQNKQFKEAVRRINGARAQEGLPKLDKGQQRQLHDAITKQGFGLETIVAEGMAMFTGEHASRGGRDRGGRGRRRGRGPRDIGAAAQSDIARVRDFKSQYDRWMKDNGHTKADAALIQRFIQEKFPGTSMSRMKWSFTKEKVVRDLAARRGVDPLLMEAAIDHAFRDAGAPLHQLVGQKQLPQVLARTAKGDAVAKYLASHGGAKPKAPGAAEGAGRAPAVELPALPKGIALHGKPNTQSATFRVSVNGQTHYLKSPYYRGLDYGDASAARMNGKIRTEGTNYKAMLSEFFNKSKAPGAPASSDFMLPRVKGYGRIDPAMVRQLWGKGSLPQGAAVEGLLLEGIPGRTLESFFGMKGKPGKPLITAQQWKTLERGLGRMHQLGYAHGDIHIGNILVEMGGRRAGLVDFGTLYKSKGASDGKFRSMRSDDLKSLRELKQSLIDDGILEGPRMRGPLDVGAGAQTQIRTIRREGRMRTQGWTIDGVRVRSIGQGGFKDVLAHPNGKHVVKTFSQAGGSTRDGSVREMRRELKHHSPLEKIGRAPKTIRTGEATLDTPTGKRKVAYAVEELVSGRTLQDVFRKGTASEKAAALRMTESLFNDLVTHRVKLTDRVHMLDNIMIGRTPSNPKAKAYVMDAGEAMPVAKRTLSQRLLGKPDVLRGYYDNMLRGWRAGRTRASDVGSAAADPWLSAKKRAVIKIAGEKGLDPRSLYKAVDAYHSDAGVGMRSLVGTTQVDGYVRNIVQKGWVDKYMGPKGAPAELMTRLSQASKRIGRPLTEAQAQQVYGEYLKAKGLKDTFEFRNQLRDAVRDQMARRRTGKTEIRQSGHGPGEFSLEEASKLRSGELWSIVELNGNLFDPKTVRARLTNRPHQTPDAMNGKLRRPNEVLVHRKPDGTYEIHEYHRSTHGNEGRRTLLRRTVDKTFNDRTGRPAHDPFMEATGRNALLEDLSAFTRTRRGPVDIGAAADAWTTARTKAVRLAAQKKGLKPRLVEKALDSYHAEMGMRMRSILQATELPGYVKGLVERGSLDRFMAAEKTVGHADLVARLDAKTRQVGRPLKQGEVGGIYQEYIRANKLTDTFQLRTEVRDILRSETSRRVTGRTKAEVSGHDPFMQHPAVRRDVFLEHLSQFTEKGPADVGAAARGGRLGRAIELPGRFVRGVSDNAFGDAGFRLYTGRAIAQLPAMADSWAARKVPGYSRLVSIRRNSSSGKIVRRAFKAIEQNPENVVGEFSSRTIDIQKHSDCSIRSMYNHPALRPVRDVMSYETFLHVVERMVQKPLRKDGTYHFDKQAVLRRLGYDVEYMRTPAQSELVGKLRAEGAVFADIGWRQPRLVSLLQGDLNPYGGHSVVLNGAIRRNGVRNLLTSVRENGWRNTLGEMRSKGVRSTLKRLTNDGYWEFYMTDSNFQKVQGYRFSQLKGLDLEIAGIKPRMVQDPATGAVRPVKPSEISHAAHRAYTHYNGLELPRSQGFFSRLFSRKLRPIPKAKAKTYSPDRPIRLELGGRPEDGGKVLEVRTIGEFRRLNPDIGTLITDHTVSHVVYDPFNPGQLKGLRPGGQPVLIGREAPGRFVLTQQVSRQHLRITYTERGIRVTNLSQSNATRASGLETQGRSPRLPVDPVKVDQVKPLPKPPPKPPSSHLIRASAGPEKLIKKLQSGGEKGDSGTE